MSREVYTNREINIFKKALCDFEKLRKKIINCDDNLYICCKKFRGHNYTGDCFDVNYKSICVTIRKRNDKLEVVQNIDVWNDKECVCLGENFTKNDIEKIIKEGANCNGI